MNEETREHHIIVNVPKDIPSEFVHEIYEQVIEEAVQVFYKKNHDYNSSWRLESVDSVTREILTRCFRTLKLLELENKGQQGKVAEGVESELKDMINWAIFGVLLRRGYGLSIDDALDNPNINLNDFGQALESEPDLVIPEPVEEEPPSHKFSKTVPDQEILTIRTPGTVGSDWEGVFDPNLTDAEKLVLGDPNKGMTKDVSRELNLLYLSLMERSNPYPAVIFLEEDNPINRLGKFAVGPCVYVNSYEVYPGHDVLKVDGKVVDKIVYIRVKENGAFDGKYETDTEAQILSQLFFLPQHKPSGEVDLYGQNLAAQLFLGSKR
jgi:hypothetical protein